MADVDVRLLPVGEVMDNRHVDVLQELHRGEANGLGQGDDADRRSADKPRSRFDPGNVEEDEASVVLICVVEPTASAVCVAIEQHGLVAAAPPAAERHSLANKEGAIC